MKKFTFLPTREALKTFMTYLLLFPLHEMPLYLLSVPVHKICMSASAAPSYQNELFSLLLCALKAFSIHLY